MAGEDDIVENIKIEGIQQATADLEKLGEINHRFSTEFPDQGGHD